MEVAMSRKRVDWKIRNETLHLGEKTLIVGILNVTPDSPADSGRYFEPDLAFVRAMELAAQGADIVEIGAESWHPTSTRISEAEELRRLVPVLKRLRGQLGVPVCVETWKSAVAEKALSMGVEIIRDPTGLTLDTALPKTVAHFNAGFILQHLRGKPEQWAKLAPLKDVAGTVAFELSAAVSRAVRGGLPPQSIAVDPGLGLGKRKEQNTEIIAGLRRLTELNLPLQVSPTGKPFVTQPPVEASVSLSAAICTASVLSGAHILRVHDVGALRGAILAADELLRERES
jgi:dihydropteroate synthase